MSFHLVPKQQSIDAMTQVLSPAGALAVLEVFVYGGIA